MFVRFTHQLRHPAGDGTEGGTGGAVDRGDDFTAADDSGGDDQPADEAYGAEKKGLAATDDADKGASTVDATEDGEGDDDEREKKPRKDSRIPLSRHKEVLAKERERREALEQELAKYRQGQQVADVNAEISKAEDKLLTMEREYNKLLADGEIDKATAKMTEIRRLERSINEQQAQFREAAAEARAVEKVRYDLTVERLEEAYPQLNPQAEEFDREAVAEVLDLKEAYEAKGYPPSKALQKAVKYVLKAETNAERRATEVEARVDKDDVAKAVRDERRKLATEKAVKAAKATPSSLSKAGANSDTAGGTVSAKDVMKMSQDEFAKIDEDTLARMRGDVVA